MCRIQHFRRGLGRRGKRLSLLQSTNPPIQKTRNSINNFIFKESSHMAEGEYSSPCLVFWVTTALRIDRFSHRYPNQEGFPKRRIEERDCSRSKLYTSGLQSKNTFLLPTTKTSLVCNYITRPSDIIDPDIRKLDKASYQYFVSEQSTSILNQQRKGCPILVYFPHWYKTIYACLSSGCPLPVVCLVQVWPRYNRS